MRKLDGWTQIPMKNARRALMMASPPPKQHEEVLTTMVSEIDRVVEIHWIYSTSLASDPGEPKGYKQAMTDPERDKWIEAMKVEINNFYKRKVWEKFPRKMLNERKMLGSRWVFKKKSEQDLSIRYKGRIVVKGYVQIPGVDFTESFAPVATDTTTRTVFAITLYNHSKDVNERWICEIVDVEAAFLEGDMDEAIYIGWPEGIEELGYETKADTENYCILLKKAMYGTVQGALQFFKKLVEILKLVGLTQCQVDPCIFYLKRNGKLVLLFASHVDDCAVAGKPSDVEWFKKEMIKKYFTIKELGQLKKHLGVWYKWGEDSTGRYLESSMESFVQGMKDDFKDIFGHFPKDAATPAFPSTTLRKSTGNPVKHKEYRSMVGKLLYYVKKIGPVCSNACQEFSQHLDNPGDEHWNAVERILVYICAKPENRRLKLRPPKELRVQDVVDSSFGDNPDTRKSTSAYLGYIGGTALVNWISKGQAIVTLSSTEAEYVSLSDGAKETTFTAHLLNEITTTVELPSIISEDNTGAIFLSKNKQVGGRTKQIDVRHHFICEKVECGDIRVQYVNTEKNPSDLLSKNVITRIHDLHASNISNGTLDCWTRDQGE